MGKIGRQSAIARTITMTAGAAEINGTVVGEPVEELEMGLMRADLGIVAYLAVSANSSGEFGCSYRRRNNVSVCRCNGYCVWITMAAVAEHICCAKAPVVLMTPGAVSPVSIEMVAEGLPSGIVWVR